MIGSALDGPTGAGIIYDSWGNVVTDSTAMMRLNTLRFGFKGMLYDDQYTFAADDPINNSDPSGALVTDAHGGVCSINATSCGDPLQFPGSGSAVAEAFWGGTGSGVSYAGGWNPTLPNGIQLKSSKVNYWGVNAILRAAVEATANGLDLTFLISSGNDQHKWPSRHAQGLAIDIAGVNGIHFNTMSSDDASGLAFAVGEMILQFIPLKDWHEMIGPGFVLGFNGKTYSDQGYMDLLAEHSGRLAHLHLSINSP